MTDIERFRDLKTRYVAFLKRCDHKDIPRDLTYRYNGTRMDIFKSFDLESPSDVQKLVEFFNRSNGNSKESESVVNFMKNHYGPLFVLDESLPRTKEEYQEKASALLDRLEESVVYNETHFKKFHEAAVGRIRGSRNLSPGDDSRKDAADRNVLSIAAKPPKTDRGITR